MADIVALLSEGSDSSGDEVRFLTVTVRFGFSVKNTLTVAATYVSSISY